VVLYLLVAGLVTAAVLARPMRPADVTPPYWVFMGATAISVLAGAQILRMPPGSLLAAVHAVVAGVSVILWAFGTWLIPLLVILGVWRHVLRHVRLSYEPALWSLVFPIGMYGAASHELGVALDVRWLVTLGRYEAWPALAIWAVVFLAMTRTLLLRLLAPAGGDT
jgi:tellurite resistance protein TehA-like permease